MRSVLDQLDRHGPDAAAREAPSLDEARAYCRALTRSHYENFTVAHWLLPAELRQHFANVYAYCRWADDLADETGDPARASTLLDWWSGELHRCYLGEANHPVFVALADTIRRYHVPIEPFGDLLIAFQQDQRVTRYTTFDQLLDYCRHSADPVGRIVLHLGRCSTPEHVRLSDRICTGLQLTNFWQDVARDYARGRVYLPQDDCRRHGYTEDDFAAGRCNDAFRSLMVEQVDRAEQFLGDGRPLAGMMPRGLRVQVDLFARGGLAVLEAIRRRRYDVWTRRPALSKMAKARIFAGSWLRWRVAATRSPLPPGERNTF